MNSTLEQIIDVKENLEVRVRDANYSFKQKAWAFIHGRKLPKKYYLNQNLEGNYDFELIETILDKILQYAHTGKGTTIVVGESSTVIKPNISERNNPWPNPQEVSSDSLEKAIRISLTHNKKKNDNIDGAIHIENYVISALGTLIRADYYGMADEMGIPNDRTCWERLPFSEDKIGTRNFSAFGAPYFIEKEQERLGINSEYNVISIVLSSSGKIRIYSKEGIIMSSDHSEIEKSALYSNKIYAYNMTAKELEKYYGPEVRDYFYPDYKPESIPELPSLVPQQAKQEKEEKVLVLTA